jgi:uncharacterized RDD family membrane protein YckC
MRLRVKTPEGVSFSFRIASPVLRSGALVIDLAAVSAAYSCLALIVSLLNLVSPDLTRSVLILLYFVLSLGYRIGCEWLWRGQSLGKRIMRLRVVDARGFRMTFTQVAVRNLLRFVDALPALYLVGGVAALASSKGQRLGDVVADTLVIWEPKQELPDFEALRGEKYNSLRMNAPVVARLRQAVSEAEAHAAWTALARRDSFDPEVRARLFAEMASHYRSLARVPADAADGIADEQFLRNVIDVLYLSR